MTADTKKRKAPSANDPLLEAFHAAFAPELRRAIDELPLPSRVRVLDLCCGDGFYTEMWADRVGAGNALVAADLSEDCLERTRSRLSRKFGATLGFVQADAYDLPFDDGEFDVVWCAQSFISLKEPARALAEMRRVLKEKGRVAILESDEYHHLLLPWPIELETVVQRALQDYCREKFGRASKLAPARVLPGWLRTAGFRPRRKKTYAADRQAPFSAAVRRFLKEHVRYLRAAVRGRVDADSWERLCRFTDPRAEESIFRRDDADLTCLSVLYVGEKVQTGWIANSGKGI